MTNYDDLNDITYPAEYPLYLQVLEHIQSGNLDRYLYRLQGAIKLRIGETPDPYAGRHRDDRTATDDN